MSGHSTADEAALVRRLEAEIHPDTSPVENVMELGQLYIEPCHREDDAIALFEAVLEREPGHLAARFWLAHCLLHHRMDDASLRRAGELLRGKAAGIGPYAAAGAMLLAEVLEQLGDLSPDETVRLLEASVDREPGWVYNRQSLGWAYAKTGRFVDARHQYERALANVVEPQPDWTPGRRHFEEAVTGRTGHRVRDRLHADLKTLG